MRLLIIVFVISLISYSCDSDNKSQNTTACNELYIHNISEINTLILNNLTNSYFTKRYEIIDAVSKILSADSSFDAISDGCLFKFFPLSNEETYFSIIKTPSNKYYYWDNSEINKCNNSLKFHSNDSMMYSYDYDTLPVISAGNNDRECKLLEYFLNDILLEYDKNFNAVLLKHGKNLSESVKMDLMIRLVKFLYVPPQTGRRIVGRPIVFDWEKNSWKDYVKTLLINSNNDNETKVKLSKVDEFMHSSNSCCCFGIKNVGILIFVFKIINNKVTVNKFFIPSLKIDKRDIQWVL